MDVCVGCTKKFYHGGEMASGGGRWRRCAAFERLGYSPCWRAYILTNAELSNPAIIREGRKSAFDRRVPYRAMLDYLTDLLRDFRGVFVDPRSGAQIDLDMTPLEEAPVSWFRDFIRPYPADTRPRLRSSAMGRWRAALSILRATDSNGGMWGATPA